MLLTMAAYKMAVSSLMPQISYNSALARRARGRPTALFVTLVSWHDARLSISTRGRVRAAIIDWYVLGCGVTITLLIVEHAVMGFLAERVAGDTVQITDWICHAVLLALVVAQQLWLRGVVHNAQDIAAQRMPSLMLEGGPRLMDASGRARSLTTWMTYSRSNRVLLMSQGSAEGHERA